VFKQDHEMLGDIYEKADGHYDSIIERLIGLGRTPNIPTINLQAAQKLQQLVLSYKENAECFSAILNLNKQILQNIEMLAKSPGISQGTLQLIGGHADEIEKENYFLGQRLKK
jgi:DNA-binding ferritin-like protein